MTHSFALQDSRKSSLVYKTRPNKIRPFIDHGKNPDRPSEVSAPSWAVIPKLQCRFQTKERKRTRGQDCHLFPSSLNPRPTSHFSSARSHSETMEATAAHSLVRSRAFPFLTPPFPYIISTAIASPPFSSLSSLNHSSSRFNNNRKSPRLAPISCSSTDDSESSNPSPDLAVLLEVEGSVFF